MDGFTARDRGYTMYLATAVAPPGWVLPGVLDYTKPDGTALFPTDGTYPGVLAAALNWEASGHRVANWTSVWYTLVSKSDPSFASDLRSAVTADVGRDHVAVVAEVDTFDLPNWQGAGSLAATHTPHSITIVGYDNASSTPTYTYLDTCGAACNDRAGNTNGGVYTISQAQLVKAMQDEMGSGFIW